MFPKFFDQKPQPWHLIDVKQSEAEVISLDWMADLSELREATRHSSLTATDSSSGFGFLIKVTGRAVIVSDRRNHLRLVSRHEACMMMLSTIEP